MGQKHWRFQKKKRKKKKENKKSEDYKFNHNVIEKVLVIFLRYSTATKCVEAEQTHIYPSGIKTLLSCTSNPFADTSQTAGLCLSNTTL